MLQSFFSLLNGEQSERIVWTADITYWIAGRQQAGKADPRWNTEEGYLQLHGELGIMPYYYYEKFWAAEPRYEDGIIVNESKDGGRITRRFSTPAGELREESVHSPLSCSTGITKHFVESERDLDVLLEIVRHRRLVPANLDDWPDRRRLWQRYDGLPCIGLPRSPLPAWMVEWAGVQNGSYFLADCPEKCAELFRLMEEQEEPIIEAVCDLAPPLVHFPDNLSSDCMTRLYDDHLAGVHQRRIERLHAAGVKCAVHLDGTVKGLLPKLIDSGFDAIEALTPKPGGDLDPEEIRELAAGRSVILWGGVPGVMFAPPYTWRQMEAYVRRLIGCWAGRPFILGVADQVPPDGDIGFCRKLAELILSLT
ncbi:MAG: hypothetical protein JXB10_06510 [Pirellulales bacterium]|nr:hypothetical protein [Pirellulales bacterium]